MRARRVRLQADARRGLLPFRPRPRAPASPLFPYTTLFRSTEQPVLVDQVAAPPISYSRTPPIRVVETRAAVSSRRIDEDTWVLDFGQNASGWLRLEDLGPAGTRTVIDHGEYVGPDGDLGTSHLDSAGRDGETVVFGQRGEAVSDGATAAFGPTH